MRDSTSTGELFPVDRAESWLMKALSLLPLSMTFLPRPARLSTEGPGDAPIAPFAPSSWSPPAGALVRRSALGVGAASAGAIATPALVAKNSRWSGVLDGHAEPTPA